MRLKLDGEVYEITQTKKEDLNKVLGICFDWWYIEITQ
ncbi:hypothetical protein DET59_1238 [Rossellomorea aquimaris]|uniref:Uncharacterized protein n=1 Tax=Rossellomorea aquimaris TaxID=189382 RepID=A0A366EGL7_9BACI|nr:hypothetical protein DET59_1238 [Rossellomorea aquimaris]